MGKGNKFYPPKDSVPLYFKLYLARSLLTLFVDKGNITCSEKNISYTAYYPSSLSS